MKDVYNIYFTYMQDRKNSTLKIAIKKNKEQILNAHPRIQYFTKFLQLLSQVKQPFRKILLKKKVFINQVLFDQEINEVIVNSILNEYMLEKKQKNIIDITQKKQLPNDWEIDNQSKNLHDDVLKLIDYIKSFIHKQKDQKTQNDQNIQYLPIQQCFDIIIENQNWQINEKISNVLKEKKNQVWIISDYLQVNSLLHLQNNGQLKFIFQVQKNPFNEQTSQAVYQWMAKNNIQNKKKKEKRETDQKQDKQKKENEQHKSQIKQEEKKVSNFIKKIQEKLITNNMIENISQLIKLVYIAIHNHYTQRQNKRKIDFEQFLTQRNQDKYSIKKQVDQKYPVIVIYYILNNKTTENQFKNHYDFFVPLLRHIFIQNKAILNVVGYSPLNSQEILEKKLQEQMQARKKLQNQLKQQRQKNKKQQQKIEDTQDKQEMSQP